MYIEKCLQIKKLLDEADAILIGAGSGLSASAGIDYSQDAFHRHFPELEAVYGMKDMYSSAFYPFSKEEERWGYWALHIDYSFLRGPFEVYQKLYQLVCRKEYFVITTNVDGQFEKAGFPHSRVFEIQGSYGKIQCAFGCHNTLYDNTDMVKEMMGKMDHLKVPSELVPKCPVCGESMEINIRKDAFFVEDDNWLKLRDCYETFLDEHKDKKLLLLELGVGFNTPGIIRFPFEELAYRFSNVTLVRINDRYADLPFELQNQSISICEDCGKVIDSLWTI